MSSPNPPKRPLASGVKFWARLAKAPQRTGRSNKSIRYDRDLYNAHNNNRRPPPHDGHDSLATQGGSTRDTDAHLDHLGSPDGGNGSSPQGNRSNFAQGSSIPASPRNRIQLPSRPQRSGSALVNPESNHVTKRRTSTRGASARIRSRPLADPGGLDGLEHETIPQDARIEQVESAQAQADQPLDAISEMSADESERSAELSDADESVDSDAMETDSQTTFDDGEAEVEVLLQPQTRTITTEQLHTEVGTIYRFVVRNEEKVIQIDAVETREAQVDLAHRRPKTKKEYMTFIADHKALLHEHHDLCLACQHPAASLALQQLIGRYSIPARMWRHGIHAPLEVLRMRLPESREHMIAFILISFNHMTLFLETVPQFEATWLECIGDLSRYRLALAENAEERSIFTKIAQDWYGRAIQLNPQISRLYHHCAILAPAFSLQQLSLYARALTGLIPFLPTRKSATALVQPVQNQDNQVISQLPPTLNSMLRVCAALTLGGQGSRAQYNDGRQDLQTGGLQRLMNEAAEQQQDLKRVGVDIAVILSALILQFGASRSNATSASMLRLALGVSSSGQPEFDNMIHGHLNIASAAAALDTFTSTENAVSRSTVKAAMEFAMDLFKQALQKPKDHNLHPLVHVFFAMILSFSKSRRVMQEVGPEIPWAAMVCWLNTYANAASMTIEICSPEFPVRAGGSSSPLPEDRILQGLIFSRDYLPKSWTATTDLDLDDQVLEKKFMASARIQRILWAGNRIACICKELAFDEDDQSFRTFPLMEGQLQEGEEGDFVSLLFDAIPA